VMAKDIGEGRWQKYGQAAVWEYCEADVATCTKLLRRQIRGHLGFPPADVPRVLHWSNYSGRTIAQIQARGMPIDVYLWNLVQENRQAVIAQLIQDFDPSYGSDNPIHTVDGEWSYARFEQWLASVGVTAWPRLDSGRLDVSRDAFRLMSHVPGIEGLRVLRNSLRVIAGAQLPIGRDGRNRPSLFPFGTATGRNAHRKSLFNSHAGLRSFMTFPPDRIGVYLDWRTQEVGIAAALADDPALMAAYAGGDVYHAFAQSAGLTQDRDPKRWKANNQTERQRMKRLQLAVTYGMTVPALARGLDRHPLIASDLIERHRRTYPRFWQWREQQFELAMLDRRMESVFGWSLHISTSPNPRSLYNFPMQANGAEMLRLAAQRLCDVGLVPSMLVHDGILLEVENDKQIDQAVDVMRWAGRTVCNGFEIGVDIDQKLIGGASYQDKRPIAGAMWASIMDVLQTVGAIPRKARA
jgi:DNA polymerase-1